MRSTADMCLLSFKELLGFRKPKQEMGDWTHKYQYEKMKRVILTYLPFYFVRDNFENPYHLLMVSPYLP
jgi:sugar phosphate permease